MNDVPWMSPERPIVWYPGRPTNRSRKHPHLELLNIFFSSEKSNRFVKQGHLKNTFFIKSSVFVLVR